MERTINKIEVKVIDRYEVNEKFSFDDTINIALQGEIVKEEIKNNQDGTIDLVLHFKALHSEIEKFGK
jgi:hypothetical protein